jgi:predicted transcriptional regulator of viral defense system
LVREGYLEKIASGTYLSKDGFKDNMFILQVRKKCCIFSHETALYLHDLTDRDPFELSVTVPKGYNATQLKKEGIKVYIVAKELYKFGIEEAHTDFGRMIKVYNKERTICDMIRNRNNVDKYILNDAMKRYFRSKEKNIHLLMEYAELLKVQKIIKKEYSILL